MGGQGVGEGLASGWPPLYSCWLALILWGIFSRPVNLLLASSGFEFDGVKTFWIWGCRHSMVQTTDIRSYSTGCPRRYDKWTRRPANTSLTRSPTRARAEAVYASGRACPEVCRIENSRTRTGKRDSRISTSVMFVSVVWVCSAEAPGKCGPAPAPPPSVS